MNYLIRHTSMQPSISLNSHIIGILHFAHPLFHSGPKHRMEVKRRMVNTWKVITYSYRISMWYPAWETWVGRVHPLCGGGSVGGYYICKLWLHYHHSIIIHCIIDIFNPLVITVSPTIFRNHVIVQTTPYFSNLPPRSITCTNYTWATYQRW